MKRNSIALNWRPESWVILAFAALVAVLFYLIVSLATYDLGFPLDDAWIHLTYARNLAEHREWAFRLGERSAGSTSPLWTALLSIGFLIGLAPYIWTYLAGWVVLTLLAVCAENLVRKLVVIYRSQIPWAGLFFIFAWHLTWSAVSGMETLLHGLVILAVLGTLMSGSRRYLTLGLLTGLSVWVRPDGLTLLGPIFFVALCSEKTWHRRGEAIWMTLIGFGSLVLPYVLFNLALSGHAMPNTFYAKQAEYGVFWESKPFLERVSAYLAPILASPFLALIPGAVIWLVKRIRLWDWGVLASLLWVLGYIVIYFVSLPAYQHARYVIPALPVIYLWGILGFFEIALSPQTNRRFVFAWQTMTIILCLAFTFLGANQNAKDVLWVENEMVATAKWVNRNLPADARLAVHDIGALGFYAQNPIVDMAGLITPEVVPFIRDEDQLKYYLNSKSVDYLITFPSFYPQLTSQRQLVFQAGTSLREGGLGENIGVYRWK
ncbi:MAG TPA: hypothetical protein VFG81_05630 [Anaerolineales bacterium]|nr:hypothetical protein [Anaerolineales bacterium]